jgi:hypothetical protein
MHARVQIVSIAFAALVFGAVFELVRRRHLRERYALVWMGAALVLLILAVWQGLLTTVSRAVGIYYPPNALFVVAFGFLLLLLLHFSAAVSRLGDQTRVLAQRVALLEESQAPGARAPNVATPEDEEFASPRERQAGERHVGAAGTPRSSSPG